MRQIWRMMRHDWRTAEDPHPPYEDMDLGFVDASVIAVVERLGEPKLATLDHRHFPTLRVRHADGLEIVPG